MFERADASDFVRLLDILLDDARFAAQQKALEVRASCVAKGVLRSSGAIKMMFRELQEVHRPALDSAMWLLADFQRQHDVPLDDLLALATERLSQFTGSVMEHISKLAQITGADIAAPLIEREIHPAFERAIENALFAVRKGFISGRSAQMPTLGPREQAFRLLKAIYEDQSRDFSRPVNFLNIGTKLGMSRDETVSAYSYLTTRNLVEGKTVGGGVMITSSGMNEVEAAQRDPSHATPNFPANVYNYTLNVQNMYGSQVQQGTVGSTQNVRMGGDTIEAVRKLVAELEANVTVLAPEPQKQAELRADIDTMRTQLSKEKPNTTILSEALKSARAIAEQATIKAISSPLGDKIGVVLGMLGS